MKGYNKKTQNELERRLRAGLRREAQGVQPEASAFWKRFVTGMREKT